LSLFPSLITLHQSELPEKSSPETEFLRGRRSESRSP
jgi:hypothetical protein